MKKFIISLYALHFVLFCCIFIFKKSDNNPINIETLDIKTTRGLEKPQFLIYFEQKSDTIVKLKNI